MMLASAGAALSLGLFISQVSNDTNLTGIVGLVGQLGISAIFIWLYYNERKERQAVQNTLNGFLEKFGALVPEAAQTLLEVRRSMEAQLDRGNNPIRRLEQIVEDLEEMLRKRRNEP